MRSILESSCFGKLPYELQSKLLKRGYREDYIGEYHRAFFGGMLGLLTIVQKKFTEFPVSGDRVSGSKSRIWSSGIRISGLGCWASEK